MFNLKENVMKIWGKIVEACSSAGSKIVAHKAISITVASVLAAGGAGFGGYEAYQHFVANNVEVIEEEEVAEDVAADDTYVPEFKSVRITTESIEKDITIYISDSDDNVIEGVPFEIKLISPEDMEALEPYITAIQDINKQIEELTGESDLDTGEEDEDSDDEASDDEDSDDSSSSSDASKKSDESSDDEESEEDSVEVTEGSETDEEGQSSSASVDEDTIDVVVTDEDGNVVESEEDAALNQLLNDKEVALQAYSMALESAEGTILVDEDMDGVIKQDEMEPGDFVATLLYDDTWEVDYDPVSYTVAAEVKDEIEYVVVKEITKEVKADVASEDGQKAAAAETETEATLTNTVEFVESSKSEKTTYVGTTSVSDPGQSFTATEGDSVKGKTRTINYYEIQVYADLVDTDGNHVDYQLLDEQYVIKNQSYSLTLPTIDGYTASETTYSTTITGNTYKIVTYNAVATTTTDDSTDTTTSNENTDGGSSEETTQQGTNSGRKTSLNSSYGLLALNLQSFHVNRVVSKFLTLATSLQTQHSADAVIKTESQKASMSASFSNNVFTLSGTNTNGTFTVNGTAISGSTYTVTAAGTYKFATTGVYKDGATEELYITYTVTSSTDTTARLKDTDGHELFLDNAGATAATVGDYKSGQTYYYAVTETTYYGWQSIDGNTYYFDKNGNKVTGTQVIQGVSYNFGTDGILMVNGTGVDVSKYQGSIDWSSASSAVSFAIIRCGYRGMYDGALHEDPYFYKNMKNAKANGVATGIYIYSTALNEAEAVAEASMAVSMANAAGGCTYPIYIDMEDSTRGVKSLSNAQRDAIINAFCTTVQSAGYKAGVYANKTWLTNYIDAGSLSGSIYIWVAQYNTSCTYKGRYTMWQFSSKGSIPGISGNVDVNKSYF